MELVSIVNGHENVTVNSAIIGLELFSGKLHNTCYINGTSKYFSWP